MLSYSRMSLSNLYLVLTAAAVPDRLQRLSCPLHIPLCQGVEEISWVSCGPIPWLALRFDFDQRTTPALSVTVPRFSPVTLGEPDPRCRIRPTSPGPESANSSANSNRTSLRRRPDFFLPHYSPINRGSRQPILLMASPAPETRDRRGRNRKFTVQSRFGLARTPRSRKNRPCDVCRRRKTACIITTEPPCK
jgi:hypothetical protein